MSKTLSLLFLCTLLSVSVLAAEPDARRMQKIVDNALESAENHALGMYNSVKGMEGLPLTVRDGKVVMTSSREWTSGFYPGVLWYLYENSGNGELLKAAEEMTARMAEEQYNTKSHDVGFMINCSYGNGYRITGREDYRQVLVNAGNSLATRFSPETGCIRSWSPRNGWDYIVIIDNMMNLELLTVASSLTGDNTCYNIAKSHADMTMKNHFRPDGSSFHLVNYDSKTGKVLDRITYQGLSDESSWSRGQAWGLYGFTVMYRQTGKKEYLDLAVKAGKYIMSHPNMPKDKIPYWDFDAKASSKTPRDASAAAVMASAYVELSTYVEDEALSGQFLSLAEDMIASLASSRYTAAPGTNGDFILKHSTAFFAKNRDVDAPLSYADYYYIEALMRYKRLLEGRPVVDICTAFSENPDRAIWLSTLDHIANPMLRNLANGTLRQNMPVESIAADLQKRREVTHLEALGRTVVGLAAWLELGPDSTPEGRLRAEYIDMTVRAITNAVNPESPDYLNFNQGRQPLVDAAFLAHGLLRAPQQLWGRLDEQTKARLVEELKSTRIIKPSETNWLFFSAMVEAALYEFTGEWDKSRVDYAFMRFKDWYKGDGWYGDGPAFHTDYYNSFVIHPMMMQVLDVLKKHGLDEAGVYDVEKARYSRYAEIQERFISPEGTFPVVGRSLAYRFGAFQALSDVSYRHRLPERVDPAQVRCALTAVISRQAAAPGTFDADGWLRPGFCGHQPHIGESYISTGSLYLCTAVYVALGLPETDAFWSGPAADWTCKKAWNGIDVNADKALKQ